MKLRVPLKFRSAPSLLQWFNWIGLILTFLGSLLLLYGVVFMSEDEAIEAGQPKWGVEDRQEALKHPGVLSLLKERDTGRWALGFITSGFLLQVIGSYPSKGSLGK